MNSEEKPESVSVALCTFNSASFLLEELESIERQTILQSEVIVCDDGSTDETLEILEKWKESVSFPVNIQKNAENLGYTKNFEQAVSLCSGEIILLADHDDLWFPNRVERILEAFQCDSELGLVSSDAVIIDAQGIDQGMRLREFVERMHLRDFWRFFFPDDSEMVLWTGCTMALRRRFLSQVLPIPTAMACHDIWFYLTFALISRIEFIPEPLICYRLHGQNNSTAPTVEYLRENPSCWRYFNSLTETLEGTHPMLIDSLEKFVQARLKAGFPELNTLDSTRLSERLEKYLRLLKRRKRHFYARRDSVHHPWLILREILNFGYLGHPQPVLSLLYDLREYFRRRLIREHRLEI